MWISAVALALTDVYAPYSGIKEDPRVWTRGERAVFWSLRYSIWGLCIVWLIFACHYNYAGWWEIGNKYYNDLILQKDLNLPPTNRGKIIALIRGEV